MASLLLVVPGAIAIIGIIAYNALIGRRNRATQALSSIEVQLTQRYELIPKLVDTVKQYMTHERGLLEQIVRLRGEAMQARTPAARVTAANALSGALSRLNVAVEAYPDLKASESFVHLQRSLNEVEAQLAAARRTYNAAATDYNNAVQMLPTSLLASMLHFEPLPMYEADERHRQDVDVGALFAR
jgi:LemA protein